jgi:MFS family permease
MKYEARLIWVLTITFGFVFLDRNAASFLMLMGTVPSETIPARYVATSLGMVVGLGEVLGGVGAPAIAGRAADRYGLQAPTIIMAVCALVGPMLALFLRETAPIRLQPRKSVIGLRPISPSTP